MDIKWYNLLPKKFKSDNIEISDEMLVEISYVQISRQRTGVLKSLDGDVKIPTAIADDVGIRTNHVSKVLSDLKEHGLVECINPEVRKGRLYRLTDKGKELVKLLNSDQFHI